MKYLILLSTFLLYKSQFLQIKTIDSLFEKDQVKKQEESEEIDRRNREIDQLLQDDDNSQSIINESHKLDEYAEYDDLKSLKQNFENQNEELKNHLKQTARDIAQEKIDFKKQMQNFQMTVKYDKNAIMKLKQEEELKQLQAMHFQQQELIKQKAESEKQQKVKSSEEIIQELKQQLDEQKQQIQKDHDILLQMMNKEKQSKSEPQLLNQSKNQTQKNSSNDQILKELKQSQNTNLQSNQKNIINNQQNIEVPNQNILNNQLTIQKDSVINTNIDMISDQKVENNNKKPSIVLNLKKAKQDIDNKDIPQQSDQTTRQLKQQIEKLKIVEKKLPNPMDFFSKKSQIQQNLHYQGQPQEINSISGTQENSYYNNFHNNDLIQNPPSNFNEQVNKDHQLSLKLKKQNIQKNTNNQEFENNLLLSQEINNNLNFNLNQK